MPKYYDQSAVESHFEDFTIVDFIDSGGFKDVFLANVEGDDLVLKLLPIDRRSRKRRAHREGEAMEQIKSSSFVNLIDYFEYEINGRRTFVILEEYVAGETLSDRIERGEYSLEFGLYTTETLFDFLVEIDELNMIHRDIKPENIMVNEAGEIRILDVGIVRFEERESITPDHMDRLGTPYYGAPEQLDYDKDKQSIKTDLFSTGIVMFETITGQHPFENRGKSVTDAICEGDKQSLEQYIENASLGEELNFFFDTLTQPEPNRRFRKPKYAKEDFDSIRDECDV